MKNNNIIQEEINRAKQLWGYDTSKTLFEQTTGNTGTSSSCLAVSQRTMCTGTTHTGGWLATSCATIDGQPLTQNDVGRVVRFPNNISADNLQFTIDQVQGLNQTQPSMGFISDVCSTTNTGTTTGTTGGPYPNGTPCYACINNQIESVLFPSNALGQPYPSCAPTAYGYQGQSNALPGGAASYAYPSIWSEVQPTNCGTGSGGGPCKRIHLQSCSGSNQTIMTTTTNMCATVNGSVPNNNYINQVVEVGLQSNFNWGTSVLHRITQVEDITPPQTPITIDFPTSSQPCSSPEWGTCTKDCSQLVPSSFAGLIANKPCNWLNNRWTAFGNKLTTLTQGSCQYKRVACKRQMVKALRYQQGC